VSKKKKKREEVCSGKKVIGMEKWQRRPEVGKLSDAATSLVLKGKGMCVGAGF